MPWMTIYHPDSGEPFRRHSVDCMEMVQEWGYTWDPPKGMPAVDRPEEPDKNTVQAVMAENQQIARAKAAYNEVQAKARKTNRDKKKAAAEAKMPSLTAEE